MFPTRRRFSRATTMPFSLPSNIPNPLTRPHKLRIVRLAANGKAHSLRCSSFPRTTHFVGLALGPLSRLRTVPALFDIYEERHRRIFLRLCLWKLCVSLCSPRFHSSAVEWLLPVLSLRCPAVQGSSDCRLQCPGSCRSRKPTA